MSATPNRKFADCPPNQGPADRANWIAVLPLGAREQHGPHLPLTTDTVIAQGLADRLSATCRSDLPVTFLPAEPIGYSPEHLDYPGTESLEYEDAIERWTSIAADLNRTGIRKVLFLNAHGGNSPLLSIVTTELRCRHSMLAATTNWPRFGLPEGIMDPSERAIDIHAGLVETSVMLALAPDKVDMTKAQSFQSRQADLINSHTHLRAYGPHAFGWKMQDLNQLGAVGNAAAATASIGEAILAHATRGLQELLDDLDHFDLAVFDRGNQI